MFLLIYFLKSVISAHCVSATVTEEIYAVWDNAIIYSNGVLIGTYFVTTKSQCALLCNTYNLCIGANLRKDTLRCQIYKMEYVGTNEIFIKPDHSSQALLIKGKEENLDYLLSLKL